MIKMRPKQINAMSYKREIALAYILIIFMMVMMTFNYSTVSKSSFLGCQISKYLLYNIIYIF